MIPETLSTKHVQYWYESFRPQYVGMGLKFGYSKEELSDIINQFFLDLLEKKIDPHTIDNPQAYLSTAFRRKLIDHYRARASQKKQFVDEGEIKKEYAAPSIQDTHEQIQANAELIKQLRRAYKELPDRCQKVVYLKFYKGLTTEQIAEHTGLSKRSVYNNLFEAVKMLRLEMNQLLPGIQFAALVSILPFVFSGFF